VDTLFVTATGTDIGKTFVTAGLIAALRRRRRAVRALKPVMTGFSAENAKACDAAVLLAALGRPCSIEAIADITPWRFAAPLSPDMAAARENRTFDYDALITFCREAARSAADALLIEGVGGIMVPLDDRHTVLDWMAALQAPTLLVAGSYLGTLSHTLSAVDVLRQRDLAIRAIVVSESAGSTVPLDDTVATITRFVGRIPVLAVPRLMPEASDPVFDQLVELI
jgi:dethiobiotin synthetase